MDASLFRFVITNFWLHVFQSLAGISDKKIWRFSDGEPFGFCDHTL